MASPTKKKLTPYRPRQTRPQQQKKGKGQSGSGFKPVKPPSCTRGSAGSIMSINEVAYLMIKAGFPNDPHVLAQGYAVTHCENGSKIAGCNSLPACGMWQINLTVHDVTEAQANNACFATSYAHKLWVAAGHTFDRDWASSKYCWGPFTAHIEETIRTGQGNLDVGGIPNPLSGITNPVAEIGQFIARLFEPSFWLRVGKGILGFVLVLYGLTALSKALLGIDLAGPAQALASALSRDSGIMGDNPAAETASTGNRVSSRVNKYRTEGSKVVRNKTKVKPTQGGGFGDEPPF